MHLQTSDCMTLLQLWNCCDVLYDGKSADLGALI